MNKKVYSAPEAEIEKFTIADTITTSDPENGFGNINDGSGEGGGLDDF